MAGSINKVILVGNLGKDPEIRHFENNASVATFTLATHETYKDKSGQRVDKTEWHNIVAWRGLAEVAEKFLKKGQLVYVEGKLRSRNYQDKEGQQRYITEIVAENMTMLGGKPGETGGSPSAPSSENAPAQNQPERGNASYEQEPDELPF